MFAYDITNQQSFQDLEDWFDLVKKTFKDKDLPMMMLIGNKVDLNHMQAVKANEHMAFGKDNGMKSYYVSAKTGDQIFPVFFALAADLAGVKLTKADIDKIQKSVKAEIVQHGGGLDSDFNLASKDSSVKRPEPQG